MADSEAPPEGANAPSKNAQKKALKEKEKADKKAAARKAEQEKQSAVVQEDTAKGNYGSLSLDDSSTITELPQLTEDLVSKEVTVIARIHNSRSQSAKLAFLMLREDGETIQAVLAAGVQEVSKQMVKWAVGVSMNSVVRVTGLVQKPDPPVASASISTMELHVHKIYLESETISLPMQVKDAERPPPESLEEGQVDGEGVPLVTLKTRLDNRVIDLQTACNQAIIEISSGVKALFSECLLKHNFKWVDSPKLLGAATEGGGGVFEVSNYFGKKAYLAQSPQFYKQMLIAGDCKRVFEIAPVFRAENSNTHRHMTEVRLMRMKFLVPPDMNSLRVLISKWSLPSTITRY
jgi:aspartyl-tRNA synthetase